MTDALDALLLLGIVQSFFLGALLIRKKANGLANDLYASLLLITGLALMFGLFASTGISDQYPFLKRLQSPLSLLFGPLVYLYIHAMTGRLKRLRASVFLHVVPLHSELRR